MSDPRETKKQVLEAAARAIKDSAYTIRVPTDIPEHCYDEARAVLTAVTPLIRAQALEDAALRIETDEEDYLMRMYVAAAIRTLKEQP